MNKIHNAIIRLAKTDERQCHCISARKLVGKNNQTRIDRMLG